MQCPICGSTNNIILENNSQKILKLRHPGLLFSNKELANKFNTRCLCPKCNLEFKYNEVTGYSIDSTKKMEFGILSALWQYIDIKLCYSDEGVSKCAPSFFMHKAPTFTSRGFVIT